MKDDSAWPWDHCPFTCYSGKAASQEVMTANPRSVCQDEPGQRPGRCTLARTSPSDLSRPCVLTGTHPTLAMASYSGFYLARLSSSATHLTSNHLAPPKSWTSMYSGHSPIIPQARSMLSNISLHCQPLWSPRSIVGLEDERSQKPRQRDRSSAVNRPAHGVGHSDRQKGRDRTNLKMPVS